MEIYANIPQTEPGFGLLDDIAESDHRETTERASWFLPACIVSLLLHGTLIIIAVLAHPVLLSPDQPRAHEPFRLRLVVRSPVEPAAEMADSTVTQTEAIAVNEGVAAQESLDPSPAPPARAPTVSLASSAEVPPQPVIEVTEGTEAAAPVDAAMQVSRLNIRQMLGPAVSRPGISMQQCSELQRRNPLLRCAESDEERTAAHLPGLITASDRPSVGTLNVMLGHREEQRARVRASGVDVPDYLDYQMGQILEGLTGVPVTPVIDMTNLINHNNRTFQMIRSVTQPR